MRVSGSRLRPAVISPAGRPVARRVSAVAAGGAASAGPVPGTARDGERPGYNNVSLTVKREDKGVCSNYVCDLKPGDTVELTGRPLDDSGAYQPGADDEHGGDGDGRRVGEPEKHLFWLD